MLEEIFEIWFLAFSGFSWSCWFDLCCNHQFTYLWICKTKTVQKMNESFMFSYVQMLSSTLKAELFYVYKEVRKYSGTRYTL